MLSIPKYYTFIAGQGRAKKALTAFDAALVHSGLSSSSLVKISSILPPKCILKDSFEEQSGAPVLSAYSHFETNEVRTIVACVGVAIPSSPKDHGMIMEKAGFFTKTQVENEVQEMLHESMKLRKIEISEIKIKTSVVKNIDSNSFVSAFAAVLLW